MITREEAIRKGLKLGTSELGIDLSGVVPKLVHEIYNAIEQYIKSLEAQLTNTEQLKCGTCESLYTYKPKGYTGQAVINPYRCTKYDIEVYCNMSCTNYTSKDTK